MPTMVLTLEAIFKAVTLLHRRPATVKAGVPMPHVPVARSSLGGTGGTMDRYPAALQRAEIDETMGPLPSNEPTSWPLIVGSYESG